MKKFPSFLIDLLTVIAGEILYIVAKNIFVVTGLSALLWVSRTPRTIFETFLFGAPETIVLLVANVLCVLVARAVWYRWKKVSLADPLRAEAAGLFSIRVIALLFTWGSLAFLGYAYDHNLSLMLSIGMWIGVITYLPFAALITDIILSLLGLRLGRRFVRV